MLVIYGSEMCPDCRACKANFDHYKIDYDFVDINKSLMSLKKFLILRDHEPVFEHLKAVNDIGIPALQKEDGTVFTDWEGYLTKLGYKPLTIKDGKHCTLNHKGC